MRVFLVDCLALWGQGRVSRLLARKGHSPIYKTERWFVAEERYGGYRIPLPRGEYTVTLLFIELWHAAPGLRRLGVQLEGTDVLRDYGCFEEAGYGAPELKQSSVHVRDGRLGLDFTSILGNVHVTALEIVPASASR